MTRALAHRQPVQVMILVRRDRAEIRYVDFVYRLAVTLTLLVNVLAMLLVFDKYAAGLVDYLAGWLVDLQVIGLAVVMLFAQRDYGPIWA